jgi:hypothetical protein
LDLGITCEGNLKQYHEGDVATLELIFRNGDYRVRDDSEDGIAIGIKVTNGFNLWTAVTFQLFAYRSVCQNGMWLGKAIRGVGIKRNHIGELNLPQIARQFIKSVADNNKVVQKLIDDCLKDTTEWKIAKLLFERMIKTEKYRELLLGELKKLGKEKLTRYDLYNLLTRLCSDEKLSIRESAENYLQTKAQEVLTQPIEILVRKYKKQEDKI